MAGRQKIPEKVKQTLRREVGFGCPVQGCANPYLEYHHFDPPVKVKPHNNPEGMIALCAQHHKKADGGAYTNEQLHALKKDKANANDVKGNLDWLRRDLLAVVGGVFYYETLNIVRIDGVDVVSLDRDEEGYLRLSINMLSYPQKSELLSTKTHGNVLVIRLIYVLLLKVKSLKYLTAMVTIYICAFGSLKQKSKHSPDIILQCSITYDFRLLRLR